MNVFNSSTASAATFRLRGYKCMLHGYFHVSIVHRTLTCTTGALTCVHGLWCACVYTRGLGTPTASQHNLFDSEKTQSFSCAPDGIRDLHQMLKLFRKHLIAQRGTIQLNPLPNVVQLKLTHCQTWYNSN